MTDERPGTDDQTPRFTHKKERHGVIGPFSGRQLILVAGAVLVLVVVLVAITTPLGNTGQAPGLVDPQATPFVIDAAPGDGPAVGAMAPELEVPLDDGSTYQLTDLDGNPIRLDQLRGKVVWLNFWASWCPPCQQETPILRELDERYGDRGLEIVGISVQEASPADVAEYAARYELGYTIGFDASGHVLRTYKVGALPTQVFIDTDGRIRVVVAGPVDEAGASALIESMLLPSSASPGASGSPSPDAPSPSAAPAAS